MYNTAKVIEQRLGEEEIKAYKRIYAPKIVAIPPEYARTCVCVLPDGEIRAYGMTDYVEMDKGREIYIASRDGGLSWKQYDMQEGDIGSCAYIPWLKKYLVVKQMPDKETGKKRLCALLSDIGPGDTHPEIIPVPNMPNLTDMFLPLILEEQKRIIVPGHNVWQENDRLVGNSYALLSEDGRNWRAKKIENCPVFEMKPPHKGPRWENSGFEPSVAPLKDGSLWMLLRTSLDFMYECFSYDYGETWTKPQPSRFHMTLTTPFPLTLQDGRTILFWNNTHPLPEQDKTQCIPPLPAGGVEGLWEDVFTNRDAGHAAITEDAGKTFIGCRETLLNEIRNNVDFRSNGPFFGGQDKSVHQFQAFELPMNKVLVCEGQHDASRKLFIFDVDWLYETSRQEDFKEGVGNVSIQGYLKSISGCYVKGYPGHCQWNRIPSVLVTPDPAGSRNETMHFVFSDDPRLLNGISGMAWNFPTAKRGKITFDVYRRKAGLQICLAEMWINPTDEYAADVSQFAMAVNEKTPANTWVELTLEWNTEEKTAKCVCNGETIAVAALQHNAPLGVSYLHLQTLARERDYDGTHIRNLKMTAL